MKKNYDFNKIEKKIYKKWEKLGLFKANYKKYKENFCIILPPPNITGSLHMGHAFQHTIIDVLLRYNRMLGKNTFCQSGVDHAGIATQLVVEDYLIKTTGKNKNSYSNQYFIKKIWEWKEKFEDNIISQMKKIGLSADWNKKRFTLDKKMIFAVKKAFIDLYDKKLIFKKKKIVNWDSKLKTVISDIEVINKSITIKKFYIKYFLYNSKKVSKLKYLLVSTTRPETIFGDTALAVNPKDLRYKKFIGKKVISPILNKIIPVIEDDHVDMNQDTGCLKITPAHDFNDYTIGVKHKLNMINIFTLDGKIINKPLIYNSDGIFIKYDNDISPEFCNIDRLESRKKVINYLKENKLIVKIKKCISNIPINERSGSIIEPMLTDQWYLNIKKMSESAIKIVKEKKISFIPKNYKNMYFSWMKKVEDWCISRQLYWGHRIPIWYDDEKKIYAGLNEKDVRKKYSISKEKKLFQESDVLDTWFSSSLWAFASLGWPKKTKRLINFFPSNILVCGFDIIFFWIAKMIMLTIHFMSNNNKIKIPFKKIYITGLIKDFNGKKMSKSKGNVIDPIDIINGTSLKKLVKKRTFNINNPVLVKKILYDTKKRFPNGIKPFGADALRFTFTSISFTGRDINWDMNRLQGYKNFCNKLWNASRFIFSKLKCKNNKKKSKKNISLLDKWIICCMKKTINIYCNSLEKHRFDISSNVIYDFVWNQFCDWYIEFVKFDINKKLYFFNNYKYVLFKILKNIIKILHPIIPFITEKIWQKINKIQNLKNSSIMLEKIPKYKINIKKYYLLNNKVNFLKEIIIFVRKTRIDYNINKKDILKIIFNFQNNISFKYIIIQFKNYLKKFLNIKKIFFAYNEYSYDLFFVRKYVQNVEIIIPVKRNFDKSKKIKDINNQILNIDKNLLLLNAKLSDRNFITKAPKKIIKLETSKLCNLKKYKNTLLNQLNNLFLI
ncbi:valine--tRNA ligase [Buchnera aphidicola (Taiwanaphis decaspermi)]|uniref:valine--tRNA ligase n=1 Tax=Buchnera aphidicola TaxID=9 RepID=UPI0031B86137